MLTKEMITIMKDDELLENFSKEESFTSEEIEILKLEINKRGLTFFKSSENGYIIERKTIWNQIVKTLLALFTIFIILFISVLLLLAGTCMTQ